MPSRICRCLFAVVILGAHSLAGFGQQVITVERSKVLAQLGTVTWITPLQIPVRQGVGEAIVVKREGATAMRVHFRVKTPSPIPSWMIEILGSNERVLATYTPAAGETSFWSPDVPGPEVKVRVISVQLPSPEQVQVDGLAVSQVVFIPQSTVGADEKEAINDPNVPADIRQLGRAVARLRFIGDNGRVFACSGFLISSDLFMTNQHCPQSETEWRSALIDFDYDSPNAIPKVTTFKQFVLSDPGLDVAIFRLSWTPPNRTPLQLDSTVPQTNQFLWVIQHPAGEPKQVSRTDCRAMGVPLRGVTPALTDFGHRCDTLGGSSGASIVDPVTRKVIGLHHLGFEPTDPCIVNLTSQCLVNRGVLMQQIISFIRTNRPDVAAELGFTP
jgi:V8-like Glu-specific endopeptidase